MEATATRATAQSALGVYLAERQSLVRKTIGMALAREDGLRLVGGAATLGAALREALYLRPQVLLLDAALFDPARLRTGDALTGDLPYSHLVVLGGEADEDWLVSALAAGMRGYAPRHAPMSQLVSVIRAVGRGELALPRALQQGLVRRLLNWRHEQEEALRCLLRLTPQEQRVLRLLSEGASNDDIAKQLVISPQTARTHVQNILGKLGVHSRLEAVAFVMRNDTLVELLTELS